MNTVKVRKKQKEKFGIFLWKSKKKTNYDVSIPSGLAVFGLL